MPRKYETISHNKAFPARIFITQINSCDFHLHYDYEIIMVIKGKVTIYCGLQPTSLEEGDIYIINSKVVHGVQRTSTDNLCLCFQFTPDIIINDLEYNQFYYHFYLNSALDTHPPKIEYSYFQSLLCRLALLYQDNQNASFLRTHSLFLILMADLLEYVQYDIRRMPLTLSDVEYTSDELYREIVHYIEQNLQEEDMTQRMCKAIGMSEKTLYRYLKTTIGITLKNLIDITRVERACMFLRESKKPIEVIWQVCGFTSEVSFYRNFKKQIGQTPNDFRKGNEEEKYHSAENSYSGFNLGEANEILHKYWKEGSFGERIRL